MDVRIVADSDISPDPAERHDGSMGMDGGIR